MDQQKRLAPSALQVMERAASHVKNQDIFLASTTRTIFVDMTFVTRLRAIGLIERGSGIRRGIFPIRL